MTVDVHLRDVTEDDLEVLFRQQADPVARRAAGLPGREREAFMRHWARLLANDSLWKKAVVAGGQLAGHVGVFENEGKHEIGYWLGREHWGKGVASAMLEKVLPMVPLRPLFAHTAKHNLASVRVLEKCGFVRVADDPNFSTLDGRVVEGYVYRLDQVSS